MSEGGVVLADSRWPVTMESRYAIVIRDRGLQTAGRACLSDVRAAAPCLHPTTAATKAEKRRRGRPRMRPGAKRRDQPFGQQYLAPDCGLAAPGSRCRRACFNEAQRESPGSPGITLLRARPPRARPQSSSPPLQ